MNAPGARSQIIEAFCSGELTRLKDWGNDPQLSEANSEVVATLFALLRFTRNPTPEGCLEIKTITDSASTTIGAQIGSNSLAHASAMLGHPAGLDPAALRADYPISFVRMLYLLGEYEEVIDMGRHVRREVCPLNQVGVHLAVSASMIDLGYPSSTPARELKEAERLLAIRDGEIHRYLIRVQRLVSQRELIGAPLAELALGFGDVATYLYCLEQDLRTRFYEGDAVLDEVLQLHGEAAHHGLVPYCERIAVLAAEALTAEPEKATAWSRVRPLAPISDRLYERYAQAAMSTAEELGDRFVVSLRSARGRWEHDALPDVH